MRVLLIPFGLGMLVTAVAFSVAVLRSHERRGLAIAIVHAGFLFTLGVLSLVAYAFGTPGRYVAWVFVGLLTADVVAREAYGRFRRDERDA